MFSVHLFRMIILLVGVLSSSLFSAQWSISAIPGCDLTSSPHPSPVGEPVVFKLECTGFESAEVKWSFGDGTVLDYASGAFEINHVFEEIGTYPVTARIKGQNSPALVVQVVQSAGTEVKPTRSATLVYDTLTSRVWAVNPDNHSVTAIDPASYGKSVEIPVGKNPRTLTQDAFGLIWVTCQDDATIAIIDPSINKVIQFISLPYASRPFGVAASPDGMTVYVTLEAEEEIWSYNTDTRLVLNKTALFPTPRGIAITPDGKTVLVSRFISPQRQGEIGILNAENLSLRKIVQLAPDPGPDAENSSRGIPNAITSLTITPDGKKVWIPSKKDNAGNGPAIDTLPNSILTHETTTRPIVSKLNLSSEVELLEERIDIDDNSLASDVTFFSNGLVAVVALTTSNNVSIRSVATGTAIYEIRAGDLENEITPQGVLLSPDEKYLFVDYYLSRQIGVYYVEDILENRFAEKKALISKVETETLDEIVLLGKQVFYNAQDTSMTKEGYISCAVCHLDGAHDGRVWDFTDRGEGLRFTTSLLGRGGMQHGPVHHSGNFDEIQDFEHDMRGPFEGKGFLPDDIFNQGTRNTTLGDKKAGFSSNLDAMAAYVASLDQVPASPHRQENGSMTPEALKGKEIFNRNDVGCAQCHSPPNYTDSKIPTQGEVLPLPQVPGNAMSLLTSEGYRLHDVGTIHKGSGRRLSKAMWDSCATEGDLQKCVEELPLIKGFDTPTLKGVWHSPPYLHDGSATTLMEVITDKNPDDSHGKTSHLSSLEKEQLVAFLLQLDETPPDYKHPTRVEAYQFNPASPSNLSPVFKWMDGNLRLLGGQGKNLDLKGRSIR